MAAVECLATAFLLIGHGRLRHHGAACWPGVPLANAIATGEAALAALIVAFRPAFRCALNPAGTLARRANGW